jgi:O-antigen/teichoic acid export membrane protein
LSPAEGEGTSGFARNTLINVVGLSAPIVISLITVPLYLDRIGEARYGVLAIVWTVLAYFAVFDFGTGRATANQIAQLRSDAARREAIFWNALAINLGFGVLGAALLFGVGHALLGTLLKAPEGLRSEAVAALPWLAAAVPLTTVAAVLSGALEGLERFFMLNLLTTVGVGLYQLAPLIYAYVVGPDLTGLIMTSTLALAAGTAVTLVTVALTLPLRHRPAVHRREASQLVRYGGWVAVGTVTSALFSVADRIIVGIVLGAKSVARYTIPATLVTRSLIVALAFARTIFPRLSALQGTEAILVGGSALRGLVLLMTPLVVVGAVALEPFLRAWAGAAIAEEGAAVGEILLLGVWMNALAVVPYALLQARGRPDLTAKISAAEVLPFIGALWAGVHLYGVQGAAWTWTGRTVIDAVLLFWAARRGQPRDFAQPHYRVVLVGAAFAIVSCVCALTIFDTTSIRIIVGAVLVGGVAVWSWRLAPGNIRRLAPLRGR